MSRITLTAFSITALPVVTLSSSIAAQNQNFAKFMASTEGQYYTSLFGAYADNVTVDMADGDHATFSSNFAANAKSASTRVFSGSVNWPTATGTPMVKPDFWGGSNGGYRFPLSDTAATSTSSPRGRRT